jgi:hypothetical protein
MKRGGGSFWLSRYGAENGTISDVAGGQGSFPAATKEKDEKHVTAETQRAQRSLPAATKSKTSADPR